MAFPDVTTLLDDFDDMAAWTGALFTAPPANLSVSAGQLANATGGQWADARMAQTFGPDVCFTVEVPAHAGGDAVHMYLRLNNGGGSTINGYVAGFSSGEFRLWRLDPAPDFIQLASAAGSLSPGDQIGAQMVGDLLSVWHKAGANPWVSVVDATSSTYGSAGEIGLELQLETSRLDNLRGGTISAAPTGIVNVASAGSWAVKPQSIVAGGAWTSKNVTVL